MSFHQKWLRKLFPFSGPSPWFVLKVLSRPNAQWNTPKIATKTKSPLLGWKKAFYSMFLLILCGGSGNYRKKMATGCALFYGMDNLWSACPFRTRSNSSSSPRPFAQLSTAPLVRTLRPTLFRKLPTSPEYQPLFLWNSRVAQLQKSWRWNRWFGEGKKKNIMVNITCSNFYFFLLLFV